MLKRHAERQIKLGAIEIDVELILFCALKLDCTISKHERLCFYFKIIALLIFEQKKSKKIKNQSASGADW